MEYKVEITKKALKDLQKVDKKDAENIIARIDLLRNDLTGDISRLTNYTYEYRLRVGNYRILFEVEDNVIRIYRVLHRREAYR